jgi:hypothetical protein
MRTVSHGVLRSPARNAATCCLCDARRVRQQPGRWLAIIRIGSMLAVPAGTDHAVFSRTSSEGSPGLLAYWEPPSRCRNAERAGAGGNLEHRPPPLLAQLKSGVARITLAAFGLSAIGLSRRGGALSPGKQRRRHHVARTSSTPSATPRTDFLSAGSERTHGESGSGGAVFQA